MNAIQLKDLVEANRDIPAKDIKKGDRGVIFGINNIDSEDYFDIELADQRIVYCSSENCWNKVTPVETKPLGHNLNLLVQGTSVRPQMQMHIFNSRYGDGVIGFFCTDEEQVENIIDAFTGGDSRYAQATSYFAEANWFPIVYGENAVQTIEKLIDHTNLPIVNDDMLKWSRAVERACSDFAFTTAPKNLLSNMNTYMEGW